MREENWQAMKSGGVTVYLKAPIEIIWERIKHSTTRPLLQVDNPLETARELLGRRESMYQKADLIVDTEHLSVEGAADELLKSLKS
jgi:shikimate kinase